MVLEQLDMIDQKKKKKNERMSLDLNLILYTKLTENIS